MLSVLFLPRHDQNAQQEETYISAEKLTGLKEPEGKEEDLSSNNFLLHLLLVVCRDHHKSSESVDTQKTYRINRTNTS